MIKKIHHIKHLGVFENYQLDNSLPDFAERNIIYGWNYSGKTTLSRLISYLDKEKPIDSHYSNLEFEIELDNNIRITQNNRDTSPCKTIVFNSDFIRNNLHFDSDDRITGIKFAVGEVGTVHIQIKEYPLNSGTPFNVYSSKYYKKYKHNCKPQKRHKYSFRICFFG